MTRRRRFTPIAILPLLPLLLVARTAFSDEDPERALLRGGGIDPASIHCNRDNHYGALLKEDAASGADELLAALGKSDVDPATRKKVQKILFWRMVRAVLLEGDNNNLGVLPLAGHSYRGSDGRDHPVLLFRTGITAAPESAGSCFRSLLEGGGVRHVVNLFDGEMVVADLVAAEERAAHAAGASYHTAVDEGVGSYGPWRDLLRNHADDPAARARAADGVARLIREQILFPDGKPPRGNVYFHCGGGMHRSGMIAGVIERCIDRLPPAEVEAHYRAHVGWRDPAHPGGFEEGNLRFVRDFDCRLLDGKR